MTAEDYHTDHLLLLMRRLRDAETGCPWDLRQNFESIIPHTLEEVYEVVDAIMQKDWQGVQEELGDLLFQVVFYCQLGHEQGLFQWSDVVQGIVSKLLRRHPHVFPDGSLNSSRKPGVKINEAEIKANWQQIKAQEKAVTAAPLSATEASLLAGAIPKALPAMLRSQKLQGVAARFGFDFEDTAPVLAKLKEEIAELEQVLADNADREHLAEEMGDILFSCVNLCRFLGLDAEVTAVNANTKFERRFCRMVELARLAGKRLEDLALAEKEGFWQQAKQEGY